MARNSAKAEAAQVAAGKTITPQVSMMPWVLALAVEAGDWPDGLERRFEDVLGVLRRHMIANGLADVAMPAELSVVLADDAMVRELNAAHRGQDKPTNVLSFELPQIPAAPGPRLLGDVVLAFETLCREAAEQSKPFDHHLVHLFVHGVLHLLGEDHLEDDEAERMEALERAILADFAIPDPYAEPGGVTDGRLTDGGV